MEKCYTLSEVVIILQKNIANHAWPTARNFSFIPILTFLVHSPSFFFLQMTSLFLTVLLLANAVSSVGPWNKTGHLGQSKVI